MPSPKFKRIIKIASSILLAIIFIACISVYNYFENAKLPVDSNNTTDKLITIPKGASTLKVAKILKENNLIRSEFYFRYIAKQNKVDGSIKAGDYMLNEAMTPEEIINRLVNGMVYADTIRFTIPEGFELKQIIERICNLEGVNLDKDKLLDVVENGDFDYKFLEGIPFGENRLEGFLFPDTYEIRRDISEKEIIKLMLNRFNDIFEEKYYQRAKELGMTVNEVITLASIIEREAQINEERPIISGVFHNRLRIKMPLQSCATVQYALGERKEELSLEDLKIESPYNTYKYNGLPPKPIASPGKASIEAALYPAETEYLYFLAKGDGSHVFSKTFDEHIEAKRRYQ